MKPEHREPSLFAAMMPIILTMSILIYHIFVNGGAPHIPLILGIFIAAIFGLAHKFSWADMQAGLVSNIAISVPVLGIMMAVGMTISTWIQCGTVPFLTQLGLVFLGPATFLPATCIICAVVSVATGTSWGTVGTLGLALMGIGEGMGMPMQYTAGAVVSGAWFGDKISPLSDTTNFTAAIVGADLYSHIRNMLPTTVPSMAIALILYSVMGYSFGGNSIEGDDISLISGLINESFSLNLLVLLPPIVILITVIKKIPALPGIFLGVITAAIVAMLLQGASPGEVLETMMTGYVSNTGNEQLDTLLSKGGIMSMMWVISLIMIAMGFGAVLEKTKVLEVILRAILSRLSGRGSLITASLFAAFGFNLASNAFVAYTVPGRMFTPAFKRMGLATTNLSRALEDGATMSAPLIPWNSGAVYVSGTLGLPTLVYAPFAFANWLTPLFDLLWAWTGYFCPKETYSEMQGRISDD